MLINMNEAFMRQEQLVAFNFFNLETLSGILDAAESSNQIVIVSFGEGYLDHMPLSAAACLARELCRQRDLDVVLHLDHASDPNVIREAIDAGFTSVMYDGSKLPLEENISNTKAVRQMALPFDVTVEGELGYLNREDGSDEVEVVFTEVGEARRFAEETGLDALAIAVGNAHGLYRSRPEINLERIVKIREAVGIPLVLHGSSGISREILARSFESGIRKINVNTQIALAASQVAYEQLGKQSGHMRFEDVMKTARAAVKDSCMEFLNI